VNTAFDGIAHGAREKRRMSRRQPRKSAPLFDTRPFWLVTFVQVCVALIVAYLFAALIYALATRVSGWPSGPLWDPSFQTPLLIVLLSLVVCVLLVPLFQREASQQVRAFAGFSIAFILVYATLHATHLADPDLPLRLVLDQVGPLRQKLGF
jgi:uncharacterized membrane protein